MNVSVVVFQKFNTGQAVVVHAFNPSTWEAKTCESLSSRPARKSIYKEIDLYIHMCLDIVVQALIPRA